MQKKDVSRFVFVATTELFLNDTWYRMFIYSDSEQ